ncbi:hypothetical protein CXG81DRAFT_17331 [Caulochytrium protostelioides]|uniref:Uncharacterized protein n=1 Tax=Caulochytrium protostelioides TaxID=1555241 RepID=A0A4P9XD20_9FUNG|nr:hypothetical protein CXG81DRAFT_17331 [Caulochytrium protostelioides]|eukprot:RKP03070.1 hypothetical protein CXG81DRAFT_17331 [Caulochytrium protostelioides]
MRLFTSLLTSVSASVAVAAGPVQCQSAPPARLDDGARASVLDTKTSRSSTAAAVCGLAEGPTRPLVRMHEALLSADASSSHTPLSAAAARGAHAGFEAPARPSAAPLAGGPLASMPLHPYMLSLAAAAESGMGSRGVTYRASLEAQANTPLAHLRRNPVMPRPLPLLPPYDAKRPGVPPVRHHSTPRTRYPSAYAAVSRSPPPRADTLDMRTTSLLAGAVVGTSSMTSFSPSPASTAPRQTYRIRLLPTPHDELRRRRRRRHDSKSHDTPVAHAASRDGDAAPSNRRRRRTTSATILGAAIPSSWRPCSAGEPERDSVGAATTSATPDRDADLDPDAAALAAWLGTETPYRPGLTLVSARAHLAPMWDAYFNRARPLIAYDAESPSLALLRSWPPRDGLGGRGYSLAAAHAPPWAWHRRAIVDPQLAGPAGWLALVGSISQIPTLLVVSALACALSAGLLTAAIVVTAPATLPGVVGGIVALLVALGYMTAWSRARRAEAVLVRSCAEIAAVWQAHAPEDHHIDVVVVRGRAWIGAWPIFGGINHIELCLSRPIEPTEPAGHQAAKS